MRDEGSVIHRSGLDAERRRPLTRAQKVLSLGTGVLLAAAAFGVRVLPWPSILGAERVHFFGNDAYYHMRRILFALERFPEYLDFDRYINFPDGARAIWPPFLDVAIAWVLLPFHQAGDDRIERLVVFVPPVLGAATVFALHRIALRRFDAATAFVSAALLAVFSAHFWYSQIGFVDHHVAVAFASTLLLGATLQLLDRLNGSDTQRAEHVRGAIVTGGLAGACMLLWPGSLLYVVLVEAGLFLHLLTRPERGAFRRTALALAVANAVAGLLLLVLAWPRPWNAWSAMSPVVLSQFQPWLFAFLTLVAGLGWWRAPAGASRRAVFVVGIGVSALAMSALAFPELRRAIEEIWVWLARREAFQATVGESTPLLVANGDWSTSIAEIRLSRLFYLFPLLVLVLLYEARRSSSRSSLLFLAFWAVALAIVTLMQRRFFDTFAVALALIGGYATVRAARALVSVSPPSRAYRIVVHAGVVAVLLFLLAPVRHAYRIPYENLVASWEGRPLRPYAPAMISRRLVETASWIRSHTPETSGFFDADLIPEYGVLADWSHGHVLEYVGRRPTTTDNFGDDLGKQNFERSLRYFETHEEAEADALARQLGARYVVVGPPFRAGEVRSIHARLYLRDGIGLGGHRLVYESSPARGARRAAFKVFEVVAGARLSGDAAPGEPVTARLDVWTARKRRIAHRIQVVADAEGRFELRLPYSTRRAAGESAPRLRSHAAWVVEKGGARFRLVVPEKAVREGTVLGLDELERLPQTSRKRRVRPRTGSSSP